MNAFIVISKYLIMILVIAFVFFSLLGNSLDKKENKIKSINIIQWLLMLLIHFTGYIVLAIELSGEYMILYLAQLLFIVIISRMYSYVYQDISKQLYNNMVMLIIIGFIILGRLDFQGCIRQFIFIVFTLFIGLFIPIIISKLKILDRLSIAYTVFGLILLISVLVFGTVRNGARNWIEIGPIMLQPSEFVKVLFIFAMAGFLGKRITLKRIIITSIVAGAHVLILVAEKDLGGALLFFVTFLFMLYIATDKVFLLTGGFCALGAMCIVAYNLFAHIRIRVMAFTDPFLVIDNEGYQLTQSIFAIGTGGLFGTGLTKGYPLSIPVVKSDFIFSAISEEMGGIVAICTMCMYLSCFVSFINVATKMKSLFHRLLASGITVMFILQVILNLGGVTGAIPLTGVTLPLISQGGSSVVAVIFMFSIIQGLYSVNVEKNNNDRKGEINAYEKAQRK